MHNHRTQVRTMFAFDQLFSEIGGHVFHAVFSQILLHHRVGSCCHSRNGERCQLCIRIRRRQNIDRSDLFSDRCCDFPCVSARPDSTAVDATSTRVTEHTFNEQVQIVLPIIYHIIADKHLGETGAMCLYSWIAFVLRNSLRTSEDHTARRFGHDCTTSIMSTGVQAKRLRWHTSFDEGRYHSVRRPRLLRTGFQCQTNLQRYCWQPECVYAGRVIGQHCTEDRRLRLVADNHAASFLPVTSRED